MTQSMTYDDAVATLEDALKFGMDPSLEPIRAMCAAMGDPQKRYRCVQVAGTNGKSSTTRMIAALLHAQGLRVGLYVSPHLIKYPERIEIDGRVVSDEDFARGIEVALDAAARADVQATEFELLTAAALWLFAREDVDWAVLECGLGGRWDATSVVNPQVAVITGTPRFSATRSRRSQARRRPSSSRGAMRYSRTILQRMRSSSARRKTLGRLIRTQNSMRQEHSMMSLHTCPSTSAQTSRRHWQLLPLRLVMHLRPKASALRWAGWLSPDVLRFCGMIRSSSSTPRTTRSQLTCSRGS